jgi:hypothetical protein
MPAGTTGGLPASVMHGGWVETLIRKCLSTRFEGAFRNFENLRKKTEFFPLLFPVIDLTPLFAALRCNP